MSSPAVASASPLPLLETINESLQSLKDLASRLPGASIAWRYFKASHQDDPFRTFLEILLVFFIVRTYAQSRTKGESSGKNFVKLSEKVSSSLRVPLGCCSSCHATTKDALLSDAPATRLTISLYRARPTGNR